MVNMDMITTEKEYMAWLEEVSNKNKEELKKARELLAYVASIKKERDERRAAE